MSVYRVIFKKTSLYEKSRLASNRKGYPLFHNLRYYLDEIAKAKQIDRTGLLPESIRLNSYKKHPNDQRGVFHTEGLLGFSQSPGGDNEKEQVRWIKHFTEQWTEALSLYPNRKTDGLRCVLGLSPEAAEQLQKLDLSADQVLRQIWKNALYRYRDAHGWLAPEHRLTYILGSHHDTDNPHLHITLFPVTASGHPLRTDNTKRKVEDGTTQRVDDLNDIIRYCNIAAEQWWRENMPLRFQTLEYQRAFQLNPNQHPKMPSLDDYPMGDFKPEPPPPKKVKRSPDQLPLEPPITLVDPGLFQSPKRKPSLLNPPSIPIGTLDRARAFLQNLPPQWKHLQAMDSLTAMTHVLKTWNQPSPLDYASLLNDLLSKKPSAPIIERLEQQFPDEAKRIQSLLDLDHLTKATNTTRFLRNFADRNRAYMHALIACIAGRDSQTNPQEVAMVTKLLAQAHENDPKDNLREKWKQSAKLRRFSEEEFQRFGLYHLLHLEAVIAERRLGINLTEAKALLQRLSKGAMQIYQVSYANVMQQRSTMKRQGNKIEPHIVARAWTFSNGNWSQEPSTGYPFPRHLDPQNIPSIVENRPQTTLSPLDQIRLDEIHKRIHDPDYKARIKRATSLYDIIFEGLSDRFKFWQTEYSGSIPEIGFYKTSLAPESAASNLNPTLEPPNPGPSPSPSPNPNPNPDTDIPPPDQNPTDDPSHPKI